MLRLFLMLFVLCSTVQAAPMVYFNNDIGIVFNEEQADIKFGMTLNEVQKALKQKNAKLLDSGKNLMFDFACNSDDCTIDNEGVVAFAFVKNVLVSILLTATNQVVAEKYYTIPPKIYRKGYDHKCEQIEDGVHITSFGWKGALKTTVTMLDLGGPGKGILLTEFRTDKFRFNFRKSVCTLNP